MIQLPLTHGHVKRACYLSEANFTHSVTHTCVSTYYRYAGDMQRCMFQALQHTNALRGNNEKVVA